jgi:hypothetical protein
MTESPKGPIPPPYLVVRSRFLATGTAPSPRLHNRDGIVISLPQRGMSHQQVISNFSFR